MPSFDVEAYKQKLLTLSVWEEEAIKQIREEQNKMKNYTPMTIEAKKYQLISEIKVSDENILEIVTG